MKFDIEALEEATRKTFDVIVGHQPGEDGKPDKAKPVGFRVLGPSSTEYAAIDRDLQIARVKLANRKEDRVDPSTDQGAAAVVDKGEQQKDLVVFACTVGWFGFESGGAEAEFTKENLARVLKARPQWARLLLAEIEDQRNFDGA